MADPLDRTHDAKLGELRARRAGLRPQAARDVGERVAAKKERKEKRRSRQTEPLPDDDDLPVPDFLERLMIANEAEHLLSLLPERERLAIYLRHIQRFSASEVGKALGITPESARNFISDGMAELRYYRTPRHADES